MSYLPDHRAMYEYQQGHMAMQMHMDDDDTDDSDDDEPMAHAASPAMFSNHASPHAQSPAAAASPEDIKPNVSGLSAASPPASAFGERPPWMTDDQAYMPSVPPSAAPSPYDQKPRLEDVEEEMELDPRLADGASDAESEHQFELTFEEKMLQRFPTFDRKKPLRFTELQAIDPIRESKKRRLEDHGISSIEAEHPHPSQEASFSRPLGIVEGVNQRRVQAWTSPLLKRGRRRSDGRGAAGNRMHGLIAQFDTKPLREEKSGLEEAGRKVKEASMLELSNWEDQIVWGIDNPPKKKDTSGIAKLPKEREGIQSLNMQLRQDDWLSRIALSVPLEGPDDHDVEAASNELDYPVEAVAREPSRIAKAIEIIRAPRTDDTGLALDFYNWSNDHYYPQQKAQKVTIRQTGLIEIIHAGPAVKLQMPFYKPNLTTAEKRARNRPMLQFPTGVPIHFDKLLPSTNRTKQQREAIKAMERQGKKVEPEIPQSTKDLSMANRVPYVLLEYSEETPLALSGYGMGSSMINYYKKTFADDSDYPQFKMGQPVILQPNDPQPYPLAFIDAGQSTRSLQTTFSNAPIFEHQASPSDYLVIRRTVDGQSRYYIREINNIFAVGQTLPAVSQTKQYLMDMPTSQAASRRATRWIRIVIKKLLVKHNGIVKQSRLRPFWPEWSDRDWTMFLKTFMFSESKNHEKFWRPMIDENGINKTDIELDKVDMTPEELTLHAAMGQAEQWLLDCGHPLPANAKDEKVLIKEMNDSRDLVGDERDKWIETRLAPWYRSQNYAAAAQTSLASNTGANALANVLQIKDEGDPTGRGEGFSLLEASRKQLPELFKRTMQKQKRRGGGEDEAKQNNKVHRDELVKSYTLQQRKIWEIQRRSLTSSIPPKPDGPDDKRSLQRQKIERQEQERQQRIRQRYEDEQRDYQIGSDRKLRITRQNKDGTFEHEDITDPVIITAYLQATVTESIKKDGFSENGRYNSLNRFEGTANLKNFRIKLLEENKHELQKLKTGKTDASAKRTIRCKQCGEIGHNSMSDICPKNQNNPEFLAKKEASKASKRGKRVYVPEGKKEFKQDDVRMARKETEGAGGPAAPPMGGPSGFKVKLNLASTAGS